MMLLPHSTVTENKVQRFDFLYVLLAVISICLSWFWIWYCDLPGGAQPGLRLTSISASFYCV